MLTQFMRGAFQLNLRHIFVGPTLRAIVHVRRRITQNLTQTSRRYDRVLAFPVGVVSLFRINVQRSIRVICRGQFHSYGRNYHLFSATSYVRRSIAFVTSVGNRSGVLIDFRGVSGLFSRVIGISSRFNGSYFFRFRGRVFRRKASNRQGWNLKRIIDRQFRPNARSNDGCRNFRLTFDG